jgi:hypothetical protein
MTGLTTIILGGEPRTLSFKNNFLWKLGMHLDCDPINVADKIQEIAVNQSAMQAIVVIVYCGMVAFYERQGNYTHGLTIPQVAEWVDDADQNEFTTVWRSFADVMGIPEASEKQIKEYEDRLKKKGILPTRPKKSKSLTGKQSSSTL